MTAKLYAMTCGRLVGRLKDMIEGEDGQVALPIPSYLIEHPKGRALFDTGMHPQCRDDAAGRLGERVARIFGFEQYGPQDDVKSRLEAIDRDPGKIDFIVNSHLHFDHAGGNELVPNATMVVQKREWQAAQDPETAAKQTLLAPLASAFIVSALIALRVSFGLAATSVDEQGSPVLSWALSRGNGWVIVGSLFLISFAGTMVTAASVLLLLGFMRGVLGADFASYVVTWTFALLVSYAGNGVLATAQAIIFRSLTGWREGVSLPSTVSQRG